MGLNIYRPSLVPCPRLDPEKSYIRKVSQTHVARLFYWEGANEERHVPWWLEFGRLAKVYEIYRLASKLGLKVPKPRGMFKISTAVFADLRLPLRHMPALIVDFAEGVTLDKIVEEREQFLARKLRDEEIAKAKKLGFDCYCDSCYSSNSVWNPKKQDICIVDLDTWESEKVKRYA